MRLKYGPKETVAQQSITGRMLMEQGVYEPDRISTIVSMFPEQSPVVALLDAKGYKTKGVNYTSQFLTGSNYNTVSSNHVQYRMDFNDMRKEHFRTNVNGVTYVDSANPTKPGLNKQAFYIYLDSNWVGGKDVILLADGQTHLWVDNPEGGKSQPGGVYRYSVKIDGSHLDDYVDVALLADGVECMLAYTKHEQEFSTFGNERRTFKGFGDAYLTLQRLKHSWSGTAAAMDKNRKVTGRWVTGGSDQKAFLTEEHENMLKWAARFLEFQILEGKGTVSEDTKKVVLSDDTNQEILSGNGIMWSGDGPINIPQNNGWSPKFITNLWNDVSEYCNPDEEGKREFVMLMPHKSYSEFNVTMSEMGVTADDNIEGTGDDKFINHTYKGFKLAGINGYATEYRNLSWRPGVQLSDGTMSNDHDCIIIPIGRTNSGNRGIELISLRPMVEGTVAGIDKGGNVSNSVDGSSEHVLFQNGVISQNQVIRIYKPIKGNTL